MLPRFSESQNGHSWNPGNPGTDCQWIPSPRNNPRCGAHQFLIYKLQRLEAKIPENHRQFVTTQRVSILPDLLQYFSKRTFLDP